MKGLYLHKTFCLACCTNFGQQRELKAHINATHQVTMKETFDKVRAFRHEPIDANFSVPDHASSITSMESQAIPLSLYDQQSQAIEALFSEESV